MISFKDNGNKMSRKIIWGNRKTAVLSGRLGDGEAKRRNVHHLNCFESKKKLN